ncbi:hypothetical protein DIPPA_01377 [Diplonema papillatum]|nr:hypothetical protein DIPPA_01377 [Diplonema papillatum]
MAVDLKAYDWSPIKVVLAPEGWNAADEDPDCCLDCGKIHIKGAFCAMCGKRGSEACLKGSLPKEISPRFLENMSEDGWLCPFCLVSLHQDGLSVEEELKRRASRDHDHAGPPVVGPEALLRDVEDGPTKTALQAVIALLFAQQTQTPAIPVPAPLVNTEAVDPRRVTTWLAGLETAQGRQLILSEIKGRYAYHMVPENPHDAASSIDHERRIHFSTLEALMPLAHGSPGILQAVHAIMVRLEALRLKCQHPNGTEFQVAWETRYGLMGYSDFTKSALAQGQKAMSELAKKADTRDVKKESSSKRQRR